MPFKEMTAFDDCTNFIRLTIEHDRDCKTLAKSVTFVKFNVREIQILSEFICVANSQKHSQIIN
jgi:hypothetical protein